MENPIFGTCARLDLSRLLLLLCALSFLAQSSQIRVSGISLCDVSYTVNARQTASNVGGSVCTSVQPCSTSSHSSSVKSDRGQDGCEPADGSSLRTANDPNHAKDDPQGDMQSALNVMQRTWFSLSAGDWPSAIDWTGAVIHTHLSLSLLSTSNLLAATNQQTTIWSRIDQDHQLRVQSAISIQDHDRTDTEFTFNEINHKFAQSIAYYFGQDATGLRQQAYDDKLWVVLEYLASIRFITSHARRHFSDTGIEWYGSQFIEPYAHRARVFYTLAHRGWDTHLCGGGMLWNPALGPYKNAITNQLFISASVAMYLEYPGDNLTAPILNSRKHELRHNGPWDSFYLDAAVEAYDWLKKSNMTNAKGLYVDGFHITGWKNDSSEGTRKCDARSEEIFTYNQAVVLSGLRGLWEATNDTMYLDDGHALIQNAITATGWSLEDNEPTQDHSWAGLGRRGILEENCDRPGNCSRDSSSFKGIYFNHLTTFCEELPRQSRFPGRSYYADEGLATMHLSQCRRYGFWVEHNARAALRTRDELGRFGTWWGFENGGDDDEQGEDSWRRTEDDDQEDWEAGDPNDRGRGRSVEVQGGGLAVVRAWLEFGLLG